MRNCRSDGRAAAPAIARGVLRKGDGRRRPHFALAMALFLCLGLQARAQFHIGCGFVSGAQRYPVPNTQWQSWVADTAAEPRGNGEVLHSARWDEMRDLGLTLAHIIVFPERVTGDSSNVAWKLARAAQARGLALSLNDPWFWQLSNAERRYLHPESPRDAPERNAGTPLFDARCAATSLGCDRALLADERENVLLLRAGSDAGARLLFRGAGAPFAQLPGGAASGRYVLSLRVSAAAGLPLFSQDTVLSLLVRGHDSLRFGITGGDIGQALLHARGAVAELRLGALRFEQDDAGLLRVRAADDAPQEGNARTRAAGTADIILHYHGVSDVAIDALCLSDERAFGLFTATDSTLIAAIRQRMRNIGADSTCPWPALTYLELSESLPEDGSWPINTLLAGMLREAAGTARVAVQPFVYTSGEAALDTTRLRAVAAMMRGVRSGMYVYPFREAYRARPGDAWYYDSTYRPAGWEVAGENSWSNMRNMQYWFRTHARMRAREGGVPWLPAVQNHSWQFRTGWPVLAIPDTNWLYEPTAAEFRGYCNLHLAYGAGGLLCYQYASWPGVADTAVLRDRRDARYGDMGSIGFLDPHTSLPRRRDTNGEDKWDSTRVLFRSALRPLGELLQHARWERGMSVEEGGAFTDDFAVTAIEARAFGAATADAPRDSFVEYCEFRDTSDSTRLLLFILNKRVDAQGGRRITLRLGDALAARTRQLRQLIPARKATQPALQATRISSDHRPGEAVLLELTLY